MFSAEVLKQRSDFLAKYYALAGGVNNANLSTANFDGFNYFNWLSHFWDQIYSMPLAENDVIIATHPKCGTTWTQQIVYLLATEDFEGSRQVPISVRVPFLEFPMPCCRETLQSLAEKPSPKLMKVHLSAKHLPKDFKKAKLIYCSRDPKDAVVSYYHHCSSGSVDGNTFMPFDEFVRRFMEGTLAFGPFGEHAKTYLELRDAGHDFLLLRFEDMKRDLRGAIRKIAAYLGKPVTDELVERIYAETTFESMRENKATNYTLMYPDGHLKQVQFMRKGQVGDWRSHFEPYPELLKTFQAWIDANVPREIVNGESN